MIKSGSAGKTRRFSIVAFDILLVDRFPADTSMQIDFTASRNSYFPPNPIPILMGVSAREKWLGLQIVVS